MGRPADLAVYGDHVDDDAVVSGPVAAYGGKSDPLLVPGAMALWATRSVAFLEVREFPGDISTSTTMRSRSLVTWLATCTGS